LKKPFLLSLASLTLLSFLPGASNAGPADIVPRGSIAYDLLGSLTAREALPGLTLGDFFRGDRLYTRAEFAGFVRQVRRGLTEESTRPNISPEDRLTLKVLETEFAVELGGYAFLQGGDPVKVV
jgi:hypothetical protein